MLTEQGAPFRILMVCVGNVCRSPLAERLLSQRLAERLGESAAASYVVESAGTHGLVGEPMEPLAAAELVRLGGDPSGFVARRLTAELLGSADLVLAATTDVRRRVLELEPGLMRRAFTLRELAVLVGPAAAHRSAVGGPVEGGSAEGGPAGLVAEAARLRARAGRLDLDVPDPMGHSALVHAASADLAAEAVDVLAAALVRAVRRS